MLLYTVEGDQVLREIRASLQRGEDAVTIARAQRCDPQDIRAIRSALDHEHEATALTIARAIYGIRSERAA